MDSDLKAKLDAILNKGTKPTKESVKADLIKNQPFITFEQIKDKLHDKKLSEEVYEELKADMPEFYLIVYQGHPIECGWTEELTDLDQPYYCKALEKQFLLSKNKINFSLINKQEKFQEFIKENLMKLKSSVENDKLAYE